MQICYEDKTDGKERVLLFLLYRLPSLPPLLESFLSGSSIVFVGNNITGDFRKIGRDFDMVERINQRLASNVGKYARERDVVQNGTVLVWKR